MALQADVKRREAKLVQGRKTILRRSSSLFKSCENLVMNHVVERTRDISFEKEGVLAE